MHHGTMTKIIGFRNRLRSLGTGIVATVGTILHIILIILVSITKLILGCLVLTSFTSWIILGAVVSPALFILGTGLIPLEIIIFLITGETKVFTILYKLGMKYWDINVYPGKVSFDLLDLIEKPWVLND
jgi:ABC-type multidrug transport system permease subunit